VLKIAAQRAAKVLLSQELSKKLKNCVKNTKIAALKTNFKLKYKQKVNLLKKLHWK